MMEEKEYILEYNAMATSDMKGCVSIHEEIDDVEDREVNFIISRDDEGCDIAFNQIPAVTSAVRKVVSAYNTGIIVNSDSVGEFIEDIKYLKDMAIDLEIDRHLTTCLTNRELYGTGAVGKGRINSEISYLNDINTKTEGDNNYSFKLIINSLTGRLGLKNIEPEDLEKEVIAVQKAYTQKYDYKGTASNDEEKIIYLTEDDVMIIGNYELGRFRGQSSVRRILRYAEGLVRFENTISLLSRRPTQLVYTAGNEKHNLLNCELPQSYIKAADGDRVQAKINYKTERLNTLNTEAKKLADGNVLAQVLEYGTDLKAIEVPEGLPYIDYIQWYASQIKEGITGIEKIEKRVVRSRVQEAKFQAELMSRSKSEQKLIKIWLNKNLTKKLLEGRKATISDVWYDFAPVNIEDKELESRIWLNISQSMRNFAQADIEIPEKFMEFMEGQSGSKNKSKGG